MEDKGYNSDLGRLGKRIENDKTQFNNIRKLQRLSSGIGASDVKKKPEYWDELIAMFDAGQSEELGTLETGFIEPHLVDKKGI